MKRLSVILSGTIVVLACVTIWFYGRTPAMPVETSPAVVYPKPNVVFHDETLPIETQAQVDALEKKLKTIGFEVGFNKDGINIYGYSLIGKYDNIGFRIMITYSGDPLKLEVVLEAVASPQEAIAARKLMDYLGLNIVQVRDIVWGTSANGLSLGISQTADGKSLDVYFRNETTNALYILTEPLWWHCNLFVHGKQVTRWDVTADIGLPKETAQSFTRVEPGKILKQSVLLSKWNPLPQGGLHLQYDSAADGKEFGLNAWIGVVSSGSSPAHHPSLEAPPHTTPPSASQQTFEHDLRSDSGRPFETQPFEITASKY